MVPGLRCSGAGERAADTTASATRVLGADRQPTGAVVTRRILFEDIVGTRADLDIMLVDLASDSDTAFPSVGERGEAPDAVAYEAGIVVKVIHQRSGPLRIRIVLADRGERDPSVAPVLSTDLVPRGDATLFIGFEECDTGWTVLEPSLLDGTPLEICVSVLERAEVREDGRKLEVASAIEVQVGDPGATVAEHESDKAEAWRELIEPDG